MAIRIKPSRRGTFKRAAKRAGKTVAEYARIILAHPKNYSGKMRKKANFARNQRKWRKK